MAINTTERDREATERRLIAAIGKLIGEEGFEKIGVNAVAARSGVSKILIYRYFGSVEGLMAAYIRQHDFWLNFPDEIPGREQLPGYLKRMFREHISRLRGDVSLRRLCRWELSTDNDLIRQLREQREHAGMVRIDQVCTSAGLARDEIAVFAAFLTASVTYLVMLEEFCPVYNGIPIGEEAGWEQISAGIDALVDRIFGT